MSLDTYTSRVMLSSPGEVSTSCKTPRIHHAGSFVFSKTGTSASERFGGGTREAPGFHRKLDTFLNLNRQENGGDQYRQVDS